MEIDPAEFRRHYESLSDEGLLAIERDDLVDVARECYDAECAERNLKLPQNPQDAPAEEGGPASHTGGDLQVAGIFLSFDEANLARGLLQSSGIACALENEYTGSFSAGSLRLMVHSEDYERACDVLEHEISEEELIAQAEADENEEPTPET